MKVWLRYVYAKYNEKQYEQAYRIYTTDSLKIIAENTAKFGGGRTLTVRYAELIGLAEPEKEETRTSEEIIGGISDKLRKLGGE